MKIGKINKTNKTPFVHLCADKGTFILEGVILPEDTYEFFKPITLYISEYLKEPLTNTKVILKLDYFNTSASRMLYNLLKSFNDASFKTQSIIEFHYEYDDEDLSEVCDEFAEMLSNITFEKFPFELTNAPTFQDVV